MAYMEWKNELYVNSKSSIWWKFKIKVVTVIPSNRKIPDTGIGLITNHLVEDGQIIGYYYVAIV